MKKTTCDKKLSDCFSGCLYFTAGSLYRTVERLAFQTFKPLGIAPTQAFLLLALEELRNREACEAHPSELSKLMNLDRSTITRLIRDLEKKRIVGCSSQGRHKVICLSSKGTSLIPKVRRAWRELGERLHKELGIKSVITINECILKNFNLN